MDKIKKLINKIGSFIKKTVLSLKNTLWYATFNIKDHLATVIITSVLIVTLLTCAIQAIFINPIDSLDFYANTTNSYKIEKRDRRGLGEINSTTKVCKNTVKVTDKKDGTVYYEVVDGQTTKYYFERGKWLPTKGSFSNFVVGDLQGENLPVVLNPNNYEKNPKNIFTWRLKDGLSYAGYYDVVAYSFLGKVVILAKGDGMTMIRISYGSFGLTWFKLPWK